MYKYLEVYVGQTYEDTEATAPVPEVTAPASAPATPATPVESTPVKPASVEPAPVEITPIDPSPVASTPVKSTPAKSPIIVPQTTAQTTVPAMLPVPPQINPMEGATL